MSNRDSSLLPIVAGALLLMIAFVAMGGWAWLRAKAADQAELRARDAAMQTTMQAEREAAEAATKSSEISNDQLLINAVDAAKEVDTTRSPDGFLSFPPEVEGAMILESKQRQSGSSIRQP